MLGFLRRRRRERLRRTPFPAAWLDTLDHLVPLYGRLTPAHQAELRGHVQVLLAEKNLEGCGGLRLTDEMRVTIAAHAALLMLGREPHYYPRLYTVLVYPTAYDAPVTEEELGGIVTERVEERFGESWQEGVVVIAWDEARAGALDPDDGENVLLHEFAHQLDQEDGVADGRPLLDDRDQLEDWARVLGAEFERLRAHPERSVLDEYGAEDASEFFAVATEAFFEQPHRLRVRHPELYGELRRYFRVDPAAVIASPADHG